MLFKKKNLKYLMILLSFLLTVFLLVGCGGGDDSTSTFGDLDQIIINTKGEGKVIKQASSSTVELTAQPADGYVFLRWEGDIISTNNPETIATNKTSEITAVFIKADQTTNGVFKLINSYGNNWGPYNNGSYYITYAAAIENKLNTYLVEPRDNYEPKAIALFEIEHASRKDCEIWIQAEDASKPLYATPSIEVRNEEFYSYDHFNKYYQKGGAEPFPGNKIALDITELMPFESEDIYLKVKNNGGTEGKIVSFKIEIYDDYSASSLQNSYEAELKTSISVPPGTTKSVAISSVVASNISSGSNNSSLEHLTRNYTIGDIKNATINNRIDNRSQSINGYRTGLKPLSAEEWQEALENRMIKPISSTKITDLAEIKATGDITKIDHSQSKYFPPVGDQGTEGACVAWSLVYYMQSFYEARDHNWDLKNNFDTSKVLSPDFTYHLINDGEPGATYYLDALRITENVGASTWAKMPYDDSDSTSWPSEAAWREAAKYRSDTPLYWIPVNSWADIAAIKYFLKEGYLLTVDIDSTQYDNGGVWTVDSYENPNPDHANTIVGFDNNIDKYK